MTNNYNDLYDDVDLDAIGAEHDKLIEEKKNRKDRRNEIKLAEGKNVLRLLPPRKGATPPGKKPNPFHEVWVHYIRNPQKPDQSRPVPCPVKNGKAAKCIICSQVAALRRTGNKTDEDVARDLSAGRQYYANCVNMTDPDRGVQILRVGIGLYQDILGLMKPDDAETSRGNITHPMTGYNLVVERVGMDKMSTRYTLKVAKNPSALPNMEWLKEMHDLTEHVALIADEKIQALMAGEGWEGDGTDFNPKQLEAAPGGPVQDAEYEDA